MSDKLEYKLLDLQIIAAKNRNTIENVILKLLRKNPSRWVLSETVTIFFNGREWCVNKMTDDGDIIEHTFIDEELDKAIEQFIEIAQFDNISKTDEEVKYDMFSE